MEFLIRSLTQYTPEALLFLCISVTALVFWVASAGRRTARLLARTRDLLKGTTGQDLEQMLVQHLEERAQMRSQIGALSDRVALLERQISISKRHVGMVRYDAFEEVGGNQSFAVALYDDEGNGILLNGIAGREDSRFYCKPLVNGRSDRRISQEEQRAIREAREPGPKTVISH